MQTPVSSEKAYLSIENLFIIKYKVGLCIARQFFSLQPESHFSFFQNFHCQLRGKRDSYKEERKEAHTFPVPQQLISSVIRKPLIPFVLRYPMQGNELMIALHIDRMPLHPHILRMTDKI